jgi:hypothetical protein
MVLSRTFEAVKTEKAEKKCTKPRSSRPVCEQEMDGINAKKLSKPYCDKLLCIFCALCHVHVIYKGIVTWKCYCRNSRHTLDRMHRVKARGTTTTYGYEDKERVRAITDDSDVLHAGI